MTSIIYSKKLASKVLLLFMFFGLFACAPKHEVQVQTFRDKKNKDFKGDGSPIPYDDRESFQGLSYFPIDSSYLVEARLEILKNEKPVLLKTTMGKERRFRRYAKAEFRLKEQYHVLYIYQAIEDGNGYSVLFTDETNGESTYEVGRYIDPVIVGQKATIDFNKAYNPYCVYDKKYDCPIPPQDNHLKVEVKAGEKMYVRKL